MKRCSLLVFVSVFASIGVAPRAGDAQAPPPQDRTVLASAALQLGQASSLAVLRWLSLQYSVQRAVIGRDRRTVDIRFRDGLRAAILPRQSGIAKLELRSLLHVNARASAPSGARAAVWEPFASELGLGSHAGDVEVQQLEAAGFSVDQAYDTAVNVASMAGLSRYNVVYMHTHSGVSSGGDGVLATGELADGDPTVAPLIQDGSVITVGVAGTSQQYYGITSHFISAHLAKFPADSLLFLNGCALLRASTFWGALQTRGVAAMVSWDQNAAAKDDYLSAAAFFNVMGSGQSVSGAISTLRAAGYGASSDNGVPATLGYVGDGSITLQRAGSGLTTPPTSTPVPTATTQPGPAATATSTPIPASTGTPIPRLTDTPIATHPPVPVLVALRASVLPGTRQSIEVQRVSPKSRVQVRVKFPSGTTLRLSGAADSAGRATITFVQPHNAIARFNQEATVEITATTATGTATQSERYAIALGKIDLVEQPRKQHPGQRVTIYVHTHAHKVVTVIVQKGGGKSVIFRGTTGDRGWMKLVYTLARSIRPGQHLAIRAQARLQGKIARTSATITAI
ncbi:MAG TPA: hypothetical protein VF221_05070 [Chloroflexota bacterium]